MQRCIWFTSEEKKKNFFIICRTSVWDYISNKMQSSVYLVSPFLARPKCTRTTIIILNYWWIVDAMVVRRLCRNRLHKHCHLQLFTKLAPQNSAQNMTLSAAKRYNNAEYKIQGGKYSIVRNLYLLSEWATNRRRDKSLESENNPQFNQYCTSFFCFCRDNHNLEIHERRYMHWWSDPTYNSMCVFLLWRLSIL